MDLDPFEPVGIAASTMRVLDVFLLHCLLGESAADTRDQIAALSRNQQLTASRGREPGVRLERAAREVSLLDWAGEILEQGAPIAAALDAAQGGSEHRDAWAEMQQRLLAPHTLPSARVLDAVRQTASVSYTRFIRNQGEAMRERFLALPLADATAQRYAALARESIEAQCRIEAADELPFEDFRKRYLAPENLGV